MTVSANEVAWAIVAAARELGADPIDVASGVQRNNFDREKYLLIARARTYAAYALDKVFNGSEITVSRPSIARMVGSGRKSADSYFASFEGRRATCGWWDDAVLRRVMVAVVDAWSSESEGRPRPRRVDELRDKPRLSARSEGLVSATPGQIGKPNLAKMLAEAAANTAKMQVKLSEE